MHDTIKTVLENGEDVVWTDGAMQLQQGWMHIHGSFPFFLSKADSGKFTSSACCTDQRNVPALGRIGDPDDIIGSVLVEDSKVSSS